MLDDADYVLEHQRCVVCAGPIADNRFFLDLCFLEDFRQPGGIGFVQAVDDDRHQTGKSLQVDLKLSRATTSPPRCF